jgi:hypothetical protein
MEVKIASKNCEHLKDISYYNNNYYHLPFSVNGCNILFEYYDGGEVFCGSSVGVMISYGKYEPKYWLHTSDGDECFIFDSESMKDHNEWT